ncbi:MAG: PBP1A family penicillin-binding protein [bacterium]
MKASVLRILCAIITGIPIGMLLAIYLFYSSQLPELDAAVHYHPATVAHVYDRHGVLLAEFSQEHRIPVSLSEISPFVIDAIIATEDRNFYGHGGIDSLGIIRAAWANYKAGNVVQGGSTITQQLSKTLFLTDDRKLERKIKEAILAFRLEEELTKERILELYLNQVYFGSGAYGIEAAAQRYFSKSSSNLDLHEAALLAGLPKAPSRFSPLTNPDLARERRNVVLQRMLEMKRISVDDYERARQMELGIQVSSPRLYRAHYFIEILRRELEEEFGYEALYRSGWDIQTSLDYNYQRLAEDVVRDRLFEIEKKRRNWKGPVDGEPAVSPPAPGEKALSVITQVGSDKLTLECGSLPVTLLFKDIWIKDKDLKNLQPGDKVYFVVTRYSDASRTKIESGWIVQEPDVDAALISMDVQTGEVLAWVGGYSFWRSQYDRVTQSKRQPGSAFKPILYAQALDTGFTASDVIYDTPIVVEKTWDISRKPSKGTSRFSAEMGQSGLSEYDELSNIEFWKPKNYGDEFYGATTLREGLAKSRNIISIHLLRELGASNVVQMARKLGISTPLYAADSLALGSSEVTLMELTQAYGAFANLGMRSEPLKIKRIVDSDRKIIKEYYPALYPAIRPETAYLTTNLLTAVITEGTGFSANEIGYPLAGKTGTTNNHYDAWFVGFSPYVLTGVWVGLDLSEPIFSQATGASAALPIWKDYMQLVVKNYQPDTFPIPEGITFAKICRQSGKLATPDCKRVVSEAYRVGTTPLDYCDQCSPNLKGVQNSSITDPDWDSMEFDFE